MRVYYASLMLLSLFGVMAGTLMAGIAYAEGKDAHTTLGALMVVTCMALGWCSATLMGEE